MVIFLWIFSFVFCNMLFRSKFPLLAFSMYVRPKWKIEILKVTQCKLRQKYKQEKDKSSRSGTGKRKKKWKFFEIIDRTLCDISPSVFFFLISPRCWSVPLLNRWWLFLFRFNSHSTLTMWCKMTESCLYPPFPGNKTDGEKGCRLKIGTAPSWRRTFYFGSCKWVVPYRKGLGTVPKIWRAVPIFYRL